VRRAERERLDHRGEAAGVVRRAEARGHVRGAARPRLVPGADRELGGEPGELRSPHPPVAGAAAHEHQRRPSPVRSTAISTPRARTTCIVPAYPAGDASPRTGGLAPSDPDSRGSRHARRAIRAPGPRTVRVMDRLRPWLRRSGWAYLAVALTLVGLAWWTSRSAPDGERVEPRASPPAAVVRASAARRLQVVHVAGEVRRPGVYRVPEGGRVVHALRLAGGPTRRADLAGLNLAARVQDGQQVVVPRKAPPAPAVAPGAVAGQEPQGPISLSSATVEELDRLDGVGPTLAARIVAWREQHGGFSSVDQLLEVPGIGEGRLEAIRPHVTP
jgi:competence protein ComEA